jgi:hypothetical protein
VGPGTGLDPVKMKKSLAPAGSPTPDISIYPVAIQTELSQLPTFSSTAEQTHVLRNSVAYLAYELRPSDQLQSKR